MSTTTQSKNSPWPKFEVETGDGRRQRSDRSRRRIIEAMFDLLRAGNMSPSAVEVAEHADVGLRTVFRHFEDMDGIYNEMTEALMASIRPKLTASFESETWRDRLFESVDRRADVYESVFPMKVCLSLRRFQSDFLQEQYKRDLSQMRSALRDILPDDIIEDRALFAALDVTLAFSTWRRLRQDQKLSVENAKAVIRKILTGLIADVDAA